MLPDHYVIVKSGIETIAEALKLKHEMQSIQKQYEYYLMIDDGKGDSDEQEKS